MAAETHEWPAQEFDKPFSFDLRTRESSNNELRLGALSLHGRKTVDTPHYVALTSRGTVPHLTQDMMRDNTEIQGIHVALEDCESHAIGHIITRGEGY